MSPPGRARRRFTAADMEREGVSVLQRDADGRVQVVECRGTTTTRWRWTGVGEVFAVLLPREWEVET